MSSLNMKNATRAKELESNVVLDKNAPAVDWIYDPMTQMELPMINDVKIFMRPDFKEYLAQLHRNHQNIVVA